MHMNPNFFQNRTNPWRFDDVLAFIHKHYDVKNNVGFRIGERVNTADENQRALLVFAFAQMLDYTFDQVKALFAEHDHFAIAMPETRQGRNILEFNRLYKELLAQGKGPEIRMSDVPELFDIPAVLIMKNNL